MVGSVSKKSQTLTRMFANWTGLSLLTPQEWMYIMTWLFDKGLPTRNYDSSR